MTAENWIKIKAVLQDTLNLQPLERDDFLKKSGLSDDEKAEIKSLLEFEKESEKFMSVSAGGLTGELIFEEEAKNNALIGQKIGIYEIIGELGLGGMGAVYLAERRDGKFEQKVALKLLKREFNVEKIRRNFKRESEIQSKLDHPNIARLLDAGTTADGVPYLVMEYVEGEPIDKYCERENLPLNARLKLFNKVCKAVAHAHRNLIIHRDLKPSNILVSRKGEPKLLDFGISKLLDSEKSNDQTALTNLGAMTPEYASPEQLKGENVTTATDIYSLGVVLYKMLTGTHPFDLKGKTNGDVLKVITEDEPTAPSFSLEREKGKWGERENKTKPQEKKSSGKISLSPHFPFSPSQLSGDIDNIILKSLSKEPIRRYKTVEQFSADIWRFIDGLPVLARPATISYRASKFFRRNRIPVIAATFVFLSLIGGIAVALWQAREARGQAQIALESQRKSESETEKAKEEQRKSEKITRFISKIIGYANPAWYAEGANSGGNARVIDVVEDLSDKIDAEFANEADVAAELHHKFGEIFHWVARKSSDEQREKFKQRRIFHALRALELRKQFYGEHHELVAKDLFGVYGIIGKTESERAKILAEAIQMMRETNPQNLNLPYMFEAYTANLMFPKYPDTAEAYRNTVIPPTNENKYQIAERYLRESLPVFRLHYKEDNSAIYAAECKLAYTLAMQEKWTDFDEHFGKCKSGSIKYEGKSNSLREFYELVEKALAEKNRTK